MSHSPEHERRRGQRLRLSFHVEVTFAGTDGVAFRERASASDVSDRGCQIVLPRQLKAGDLVHLRVIRKFQPNAEERPFLYRVIWAEPSTDGWVAGLAALDSGNPWRVNFPAASLATK